MYVQEYIESGINTSCNINITGVIKVAPVTKKIKSKCLSLYGHVMHRGEMHATRGNDI